MGKPELFSYLSAFVTIVLAVALADIIQSSHRLLRARKRVEWDARPLVFGGIIAICVVSEFFSLWSTFDITQVSIGRLLWLLSVPTVFAFLAYSALPDDIPDEGMNLTDFWDAEHRLWAIMWFTATTLDFARATESTIAQGRDILPVLSLSAPIAAGAFSSGVLIYFARAKVWSWVGLLLLGGTVLYGVHHSGITVKTG